MAVRLTSTLNETVNDTGRTVYCGPTIVSAITGVPVSKVEARIWAYREQEDKAARKRVVTGTYDDEVRDALGAFGYEMVMTEDFKHLDRKERPTLWNWMQRPRSAWVHYVIAVHKGKVGHWIVVKGVMLCDTFTGGTWKFVVDGPHRGARMMDVHIVRRITEGAAA
jgi:hypothetical protein